MYTIISIYYWKAKMLYWIWIIVLSTCPFWSTTLYILKSSTTHFWNKMLMLNNVFSILSATFLGWHFHFSSLKFFKWMQKLISIFKEHQILMNAPLIHFNATFISLNTFATLFAVFTWLSHSFCTLIPTDFL